MKILRLVVGILCLCAALALGAIGASAAEAAIEGKTTTEAGAAVFTTGLFLAAGFLLTGIAAIVARKSDAGTLVSWIPLAVGAVFAGGGASHAAAAGLAFWVWAGWALVATLFVSGFAGVTRRQRKARIGLPPGPGRA